MQCLMVSCGSQVTSSTQSTDHVQWAVSSALGLPNNKVNVHCRRAGGGFGGKFSRSRPAATAVAVAAYKLKRQVRLTHHEPCNTALCGGDCLVLLTWVRFPCCGWMRCVCFGESVHIL